MKKEIIKLKKTDIDKAIIRGLGRAAWEVKKSGVILGRTQTPKTMKKPRHKARFSDLEE